MTLQEIFTARNIPEEQAKAILEDMKANKIFIASEENLDIRYAKLKTDHENLTAQHNESTKLINQFKTAAKDNEALQGKLATYESTIAQLQEQIKTTQLEAEIKVALLSAKATDVDYMTFKLREKDELELDEQGHIKGIDDKIAGLKTQFPNQFESGTAVKEVQINKLPTPEQQNKGMTRNELLRKPYAERAAFATENPEAYKNIMNQ